MLVFDGGSVVEAMVVANKQPPSKTSIRVLVFNGGEDGGGKQAAAIENEHVYARFQWRRRGGGGKQAATIENEHAYARF